MISKITPVFQGGNTIPIVFSANQSFVPILAVMLQSIIEQSTKKHTYDVMVLSRDIDHTYEERLHSMLDEYDNFSLRFIDVSEYFERYTFYVANRPDITVETYFRLVIPELMAGYEKVLYLDGDMVANADVADLFEVELGDCMVAACVDCDSIGHCHHGDVALKEYREDILKLKDLDCYFCAGVLVMNLTQFRKMFSSKQLLELAASYDWKQHDQDVLNMVCNQDVKLLPVTWDLLRDAGNNQYMPGNLYEEFLAAEREPKIIHYGGKRKPWIYFDVERGEYFWQYAGKTPFYREILSMVSDANAARCIVRSSKANNPVTEEQAKEVTLKQFAAGKIGFRYVWRYFRAWLGYKLKRKK